MSWYSLISNELTVINSQEYYASHLTGDFIGNDVVDKILKKNELYLHSRKAFSSFLCKKLCRSMDYLSGMVSEKLLERVVLGQNLPELFPELFKRIRSIENKVSLQKISDEPLMKEPKEKDSLKAFTRNIFDQLLASNGNPFSLWTHAFEQGGETVGLLAKKALIKNLQPLCQKALKTGLKKLVKTGIENGYDYVWKKGISIASISAIYKLAFAIFQHAAPSGKQSFLNRSCEIIQNTLPSPVSIFYVITACHLGQMTQNFWDAFHSNSKKDDINKPEVKALIIGLIKEPIKKALETKEVFQQLTRVFSPERVDAFIVLLINETIDLHWNELHTIRLLKLPLVA